VFFFSSGRRHTRSTRDWSSDVCSSDLFSPVICRVPFWNSLSAIDGRTRSLSERRLRSNISPPGEVGDLLAMRSTLSLTLLPVLLDTLKRRFLIDSPISTLLDLFLGNMGL